MKRTRILLATSLVLVLLAAIGPAMAQPTPKATTPAQAELAAIRNETQILRAQIKDIKAQAQLEKATQERDKARAELARLTAGGAKQ